MGNIKDSIEYKTSFAAYLENFLSPNKVSIIHKTLQQRTNRFTVVLEDIFQAHNASAVIRTVDCFGLTDVHIIENRYKYKINPDVMMGAEKWVNINKYRDEEHNTLACYDALKAKGYKIVATTPHKDDCNLEDLDCSQKIALVFGTEREGLTPTAIQHADSYVKIPMYGFTESLNISVTAALFIHYISNKVRNSGVNWQLSDEEQLELRLKWYRRMLKRSDLIEEEFLAKRKE